MLGFYRQVLGGSMINRMQRSSAWCWIICLAWLLMPTYAIAQPGNLLGGKSLLPGLDSPTSLEPTIVTRLVPPTAAVGEIVTLEIRIGLGPEAYVYSQNPNVGAETRINIKQVTGLEPIDGRFIPDKEPKTVIEPLFDNAKLEKFYGGVTWSRKYRVTAPQASVSGQINFQVCDEATCNPFEEPIQLTLKVAEANAPTPSLKMLLEEAEPSVSRDDPAAKVTETSRPRLTGTLLASQTLRSDREVGGDKEPISFEAELLELPSQEEGLSEVVLAIRGRIEGKWHLYALDQDPKMFALPTVIKVEETVGLTPIDAQFLPDHAPEVTHPLEDVTQLVHHGEVTWQRRYRLDPALFSGSVTGSIRYQVCEDGSCLPPHTLSFQLNTSAVAPLPTTETASTVAGPVEEELPPHKRGLIPFLITGILFGYLALLTPCVFPMIPITISFFLKQAEKEHHNPIGMASLYCFGIIGTFTLIGVLTAAVFGSAGLNTFANNVWFNLFLAAVLLFFGFNMLGLFEIRVPSWLLTWSSTKERSGGVIGVLFMAFTFTLVSFTCTFAFVGFLLPMAARGEFYWPILGMLAFSTAFASPFFFLALFPSYLKKMPKSGGWMNNVKVTCGLVELGAAFKFLSVADVSWFSEPFLFDYSLVMTAWMVIGVITGMYLLGMFRLPHDSPTDHIGVVRLGFALSFLGFSAYLAAGIFGTQKPDGFLWQQIVAFAPPTYETKQDIDLGPAVTHDELLYALDVDQAIEHARSRNQPLFFDFTGTNCINCRFMEINVFPKEENRELLEQFVRVQLYTDTIPAMQDAQRSTELLTKNRTLQSEWFNDATLPAYAVVTPDGKTILGSYKGSERSQGQFNRFLKTGLEEWQRVKATASRNSSTRR